MKSNAICLLLLVLVVPALVIAQVREGDRNPTAEIDQPPRAVEDLQWSRESDLEHSVLTGGSSGTLPVNQITLPGLCDLDPDAEGCGTDDGGGGGPGPTDPPPSAPVAHCGIPWQQWPTWGGHQGDGAGPDGDRCQPISGGFDCGNGHTVVCR